MNLSLVERLKIEAQKRRKRKQYPLAKLLEEAADALRPKSIEEALEECRKWQLTDEEVEELLK